MTQPNQKPQDNKKPVTPTPGKTERSDRHGRTDQDNAGHDQPGRLSPKEKQQAPLNKGK